MTYMLIAVFIIINFLIRFPDLYHYLNTPTGYIFTGQSSWFDPWDINIYLSAINYGINHGIMLDNRYDISADKAFIYPLYTLLGKAFSLLGIKSAALIFHLSAILISYFLILKLKELTKILIKNKKLHNFCLLSICIGGGLGWLFFPKIFGADIGTATFTLHGAFRSPHEGISLYLFLSLIILLLNTKSLLAIRYTLLIILLLTLHPYLFLIIFLLSLYKRQYQYSLITLLLFTLYYLLFTYTTPSTWYPLLHQTHLKVSLAEVLIGLVLLLPFMFKKPNKFLLFWFLIQLILVFLPIPINRLFLKNLYLPACLLAYSCFPKNFRTIHYSLFTVFLSFTSLLIFYHRLLPSQISTWTYRTTEDYQAIRALDSLSSPNSIVITSYPDGNLIPTLTNQKVYIGHSIQTPNFHTRSGNVQALFANSLTQSQFNALIADSHAQLILSKIPLIYPRLTLAYHTPQNFIYRIMSL